MRKCNQQRWVVRWRQATENGNRLTLHFTHAQATYMSYCSSQGHVRYVRGDCRAIFLPNFLGFPIATSPPLFDGRGCRAQSFQANPGDRRLLLPLRSPSWLIALMCFIVSEWPSSTSISRRFWVSDCHFDQFPISRVEGQVCPYHRDPLVQHRSSVLTDAAAEGRPKNVVIVAASDSKHHNHQPSQLLENNT